MARVLLTGSSGGVGRATRPVLEAAGWVVEPFDLADGNDLRDEAAVLRAVSGCEAVVHAGAIAHDSAGTPAQIVATNLLGTWHVLQAAETHSVSRVVYFSSGQVFGFAEGEACLPTCRRMTLTRCGPRVPTGCPSAWPRRCAPRGPRELAIPTTVLRPVMILDDSALLRVTEDDAELGAFVHVDDVAAAVLRALAGRPDGHIRLTLCGPGRFDTSCRAADSRVVAGPGLAVTVPGRRAAPSWSAADGPRSRYTA